MMKAIIWGSCGSLPSPAASATIRDKVKAALWAARHQHFTSQDQVDAFLETLPHCNRGTYKANTSCVQIDAAASDVIFCDAGSGLRDFALAQADNQQPQTYHIFLSHLHWDHIQGFPFFAPAYVAGNRIIFHGMHRDMEAAIRNQMAPPYFPVPFEAMQADIEFDIRAPGAGFQIGEINVSTIQQHHPGTSWGYRFEQHGKSIVYSSDSEHGLAAKHTDEHFVDFFQSADVLIFDGQYTPAEAASSKLNWGHSDPITAVELSLRAQVKKLILFHHEPGYTDRQIEQIYQSAVQHLNDQQAIAHTQPRAALPLSIAMAYDGLIVEA